MEPPGPRRTLADLHKAASLAQSGSEAWAGVWIDQLPVTMGASGLFVLGACVMFRLLGARCPLTAPERVGAVAIGATVFATFRLPPPGVPFALFTGTALVLGASLLAVAEWADASLGQLAATVFFTTWPFITCALFVTVAALGGTLAGRVVDRVAPPTSEGAG